MKNTFCLFWTASMQIVEHKSNGLKCATGFLKTIILYERKWAFLAKTKISREIRIWKHNLKVKVRLTGQYLLWENLEIDEQAHRTKIEKHRHTYPTRHHKNNAFHVEKIFRYIHKEFFIVNKTGHFKNYGRIPRWTALRQKGWLG